MLLFQVVLTTGKRHVIALICISDQSFTKRPFSHPLRGHSVTHREAILKHGLLQQPSVIAQLDEQTRHNHKFHQGMFLKQLSAMKFLLRQGLALRGHKEAEGNLP